MTIIITIHKPSVYVERVEDYYRKFRNQRLDRWKWKLVHWWNNSKPPTIKRLRREQNSRPFCEPAFVFPKQLNSLVIGKT